MGDTVWLAGRDRYKGEARQKVVQIVRGRVLTLASPSDWGRILRRESSQGGTWAFILMPIDGATTRLVVRSRGPEAQTLMGRLFWMAVFEPAHFIMERKMMLRLRALAERTDRSALPLAS